MYGINGPFPRGANAPLRPASLTRQWGHFDMFIFVSFYLLSPQRIDSLSFKPCDRSRHVPMLELFLHLTMPGGLGIEAEIAKGSFHIHAASKERHGPAFFKLLRKPSNKQRCSSSSACSSMARSCVR